LSRPWPTPSATGRGERPRTTIRTAHLHDLEPVVSFKRQGLTIFYGERLGDLVAKHLTKDEIRDLTLALARRVTRELFDAANEMATVREQYARDRAARLKK
jgi:hypothetical protein